MRISILSFITFCLCFSCQCVSAQSLNIEPGIGLGLKIPSDWDERRGGFGLQLGLAYEINKKWSISLAYQTFGTGTFWSEGNPDFSDETSDVFGFNKTNSNLWILNPRYFLGSNKKNASFLVGTAFGIQQTVRDINVNGQKTISESVFTIAPEIGYSIDNFIIALRWYPRQETPGFEAIDQSDGRRKVFEPVKFSLITLHVAYSIRLSKRGFKNASD